jgi:hypothetical protein
MRFGLLFFLALPILRADPAYLISNYDTNCLPTIANVGPVNDDFIGIYNVPWSYLEANAACAIPPGYAPPLALYDEISHPASDSQDNSLVLEFELSYDPPETLVYVSGPTPPAVPEPQTWGFAALGLLIVAFSLRRKDKKAPAVTLGP